MSSFDGVLALKSGRSEKLADPGVYVAPRLLKALGSVRFWPLSSRDAPLANEATR
jgi:hypothetical protein